MNNEQKQAERQAIIDNMADEAPLYVSEALYPYISEAMEIYANNCIAELRKEEAPHHTIDAAIKSVLFDYSAETIQFADEISRRIQQAIFFTEPWPPKPIGTTVAGISCVQVRKEEAPSEWVDINVRVPESGRCVLLYSKEGRVAEGAYNNVKGVYEQWRWNAIVNPTHWMYLPNPPSDKQEAPSEGKLLTPNVNAELVATHEDAAIFWAEYFGSTKEEANSCHHMTIDCMMKFANLIQPDVLSSQMYQAGILEGKRQAEETIADLRSALGDIQGEMTEKALAFAEWIAVMRCTCSMATLKWTIPHIIEDCTTAELYEQFQNAEPK